MIATGLCLARYYINYTDVKGTLTLLSNLPLSCSLSRFMSTQRDALISPRKNILLYNDYFATGHAVMAY